MRIRRSGFRGGKISTVEALKFRLQWSDIRASRRHLFLVALVGTAITFMGVGSSDAAPSCIGVLSGPITAIILLLVFTGLGYRDIDTRTVPNQGIRRSASSAGIVWLGVGLSVGLVLGLSRLMNVRMATGFGLIFGTLVALAYGGWAVLQHTLLRLLLFLGGQTPASYARFLDYAAERLLVQRVGGGYMFVHRLLQEYFAALEPASLSIGAERGSEALEM